MQRRLVVITTALAVLLSACGTRKSTEEIVTAANTGSGGSGSQSNAAGGIAGSGGPVPGGGNAAQNKFGTLDIPCGPGGGEGNTASDQGVTPTEIKVTTISDPGGIKPGLNQGIFDSMEAFYKWCNALGGINGRTLNYTLRDGEILKYKEAVDAACVEDFALVGGMGVLDNLGAQAQVDCGIVNVVGLAVNPEQTLADLTYQSLPNIPTRYNVGPTEWVKKNFPDKVGKSAAIYTSLSVTKMQSERLVEAYTKRGFTFVVRVASNLSEENWGPIVSQMKAEGVTFMTLSSSFEEIVPLAKAMKAQNFAPIVELETNFYNDKFPLAALGSAEGFYVRALTWPVEERSKNPATDQFLNIMDQYKPGGVKEFLGAQAFSSGLLFATAVKRLGANVTRAGLEAEIKKITQWDGGGLQSPANPGGKSSSACFIIMKVQGEGFVREYPLPDKDKAVYDNPTAKGMACPDNGFESITGRDYEAMGAKRSK